MVSHYNFDPKLECDQIFHKYIKYLKCSVSDLLQMDIPGYLDNDFEHENHSVNQDSHGVGVLKSYLDHT